MEHFVSAVTDVADLECNNNILFGGEAGDSPFARKLK